MLVLPSMLPLVRIKVCDKTAEYGGNQQRQESEIHYFDTAVITHLHTFTIDTLNFKHMPQRPANFASPFTD